MLLTDPKIDAMRTLHNAFCLRKRKQLNRTFAPMHFVNLCTEIKRSERVGVRFAAHVARVDAALMPAFELRRAA